MKIYYNQLSRIFILFFLLQFSFLSNSSAQNKYNIKQFGNEFGTVATQPTNWSTNELLTILGIAGLTYGTMYIDEHIKFELQNNQKYAKSFPIKFGKFWGEAYATLAIGGGLYGYGLLADNTKSKKIGYEVGQSAFFTGLITVAFKYAFGRERPRHNDNPFSFKPFSFRNSDYMSINSGHTALAFSLSTVLAANTENTYLKIISFIPAVLTAAARVYQNQHWTSDVLLGGIIGYSVGRLVTNLHSDVQLNTAIIGTNRVETNLFAIRIPL